jgi:DNA polymerase III epsilon subunit-like protein
MGLTHLNGDILCVIDVETSGHIPGFHDLLQICILPLDYKLDMWKDFAPFYMEIQPKRPENYGKATTWNDEEVAKKNRQLMAHAQVNGMDPYRAADLFDEWFAKLGLGYRKKIAPLAHNWPFDRGFVIDWLGEETFIQCIDPRYRDTMVVATFMNDQADFKTEPYPFNKVNLSWLAKQYNIDHSRAHDALADCWVTAQVYKRLVMSGP